MALSKAPHLALWTMALAALVWGEPVQGQTLLSDPFDESVFGYVSTVNDVTVEWSAVDVDAAVDSGSALLTNVRSDGSSGPVNWVLQCFAVEPGAAYPVGASILIPENQGTTGVAQVFLSWYGSGSCTAGSFLGFGRTFEIRSAGSWQRSEEPLTAPTGAAGARVGLTLFKDEAFGTLRAHFDDLVLMPEPGPGASVLAVLAPLAIARRRLRQLEVRCGSGSRGSSPARSGC